MQGMSNETHTALVSGQPPRSDAGRKAFQHDLETWRWLNDANEAKMRGLYVDFEGGKWLQPKDVRPDDLTRALEVAAPFIEETRRQQSVAKSL
jgi:AbiV family abortive infection protein